MLNYQRVQRSMSLFPSNLAGSSRCSKQSNKIFHVGIIWWDEYHDGKLAVVFFPRSMIRVFPCLVTVDGRWVESFWPFKGSQATISPIFSRPVVLHQVIFWNQCFYLVGGLEHEWIICPFSWEFHHPDEVHHFYIFFRVGLNHQPDRKPYHVPSGNLFLWNSSMDRWSSL